ncbi:MAG TPA: FkbM family methyltransferase [Candidatus Sulfotelmatobacter sp.]|nr:FkbM family methyltransferase [Candidatus Sulfotelmatobacter sp.]
MSAQPVQLRVSARGAPISLYLYEREFVSDIIRRDLYWELTQTRWLAQRARPTDTLLDLGANLGYYTVLMSRLAPDGCVHAFEPDPENFALLRRNCELNGCRNVVLHNVALADRDGAGALYRSGHNAGDHRISAQTSPEPPVAIAIETADAVLADLPRVDIVKCDIQGAEVTAFRGMQRLMARSTPKPSMIVEFEPSSLQAMGTTPAQLLDLLDDWGYRYAFVGWENVFSIDRAALEAIADHWLKTRTPGFLDLILSPA